MHLFTNLTIWYNSCVEYFHIGYDSRFDNYEYGWLKWYWEISTYIILFLSRQPIKEVAGITKVTLKKKKKEYNSGDMTINNLATDGQNMRENQWSVEASKPEDGAQWYLNNE